MTRPVERFTQLLDRILSSFDLSHDFGRKRAHEAAIEYARQNLMDDPHCEDFLQVAAKRLGFTAASFEGLGSKVKLGTGAWLDLWISDEDDEVALTGTREGIQYLIDLLTQLRDSPAADEHIHLDRATHPMTDNSANLVLFKEEETWFTGADAEAEEEQYPEREIVPESIFAIQFIHYPPDDLPITAQKLYRVSNVEKEVGEAANLKEFGEGSEDRYYRFSFVADTGERFNYTFHLDDPGVNYFTHREIVSLAMKSL
ncbi:MAG TPA: hypothetical protein VNM92_14655 [Thermoanaerobaculia bacterium]|nr:hypothetical protein [Thermoanaerobaculia bacterium]